MTLETIIHHYNRLNGNSITRSKLKEFHGRVQKALDNNSHGPLVKDVRGILTRLTNFLKNNIEDFIIDRVEVIPIDTTKQTGKILRVASGYDDKSEISNSRGKESSVKEISISEINTDTKRFQNRVDSFSEASANNVAVHFDVNKFDPIVVWKDTKNKKTYVLSGHSRLEGMKRRKASTIPVRYFEGTEEEAIKFARVEANRSANQESLVEDLAAYKMMRDGKEGVKPATKTELNRIFKGKVAKLEAYSYLNPNGLFLQSLSQSNTSNYPYLERIAQWIGIVRNQYPVISATGEDNIFHFFYSDKSGRNIKISKDDFFALVKKKVNGLRKDESVLFPECSSEGCKQTIDREADPQKGEAFKRLREINEALESIREKLTSKDATVRVTTDEEKKYLRATAEKLEAEKQRINRDLDLIDKSQASLFGVYGLECGCPVEEKTTGLGFTKDGQVKIYEMITGKVLDTMKKDGLFWRTKWDSGKVPAARNFPTERGYRGANWVMLTLMANMNFGYSSPWFMTFNAIKKEGGTLRKKSQGWPVVYYNRVYTLNGKRISEEQFNTLPKDVQEDDVDIRPFLQYYTVFNGQDIEGIKFPETKYQQRIKTRSEFERLESAEELVNKMPNRPDIDHGNRTAHYLPGSDKIDMPDKKAFDNAQDYYSVLFHELIHSTAHKSRINRPIGGDKDSKQYAFEELVAELGAAYLCAEAGILYHTLNDSAVYLKHYTEQLNKIMKDDNKFFLKAAAAAQKAADYILNRVEQPVLNGPQYDAFNIQPKKKKRGPLNELQMAQLQDAIKAGRTPKVNLKAKMNAKQKAAPLFDQPINDPKQASLFGKKSLSGVNYQYYALPLGEFEGELYKINSDSNAMFWGKPGHGKTVKMLRLAQHFAEQGKKVTYISEEEYGKSTFDEKLNEHNIGHPNLHTTGELNESDIAASEIIFFDSVNTLQLKPHEVKALDKKYPNRLFVLIVQTTKDGQFRGGRDWEHLVDVAGEISNRKIILHKNRFDKENPEKMSKLMTEDAIAEATKRYKIRSAVKANVQPSKSTLTI